MKVAVRGSLEFVVSVREHRSWRLGRLGRRVLTAFLVVSLVPLLLTAWISYWRSATLLEDFLEENAGKTARAYAADLDLFLERRRQLLRRVPSVTGDLSELLAITVEADPNLEALVKLTGEGEVSESSAADVDPWAVQACARLVGDTDQAMTHAGAGHAHEVVIAVPRSTGVLCGQVTFTLHQDMLSERAQGIGGGTAYIVDRSGTVVCHAFEEDEPHVGRGESLSGPAVNAAAKARPWSGVIEGSMGPAFAAFAPAESLPWGVWVEVPREVAAAPLRSWLAQTVAFAGAFAALIGLLAVVLVQRIVSPIHDVVTAVKTIAGGRYGETLEVRGDDEVAELAREVNRMSGALERSYTELDDRVSERTRQLQSAREFSDLLLDTLKDRILVVDAERRVVRANQAAVRAYGAEVLGAGCDQVHRPSGGVGEACPASRCLDSGEPVAEERVYERGGRSEILAVEVYPIFGDGGEPEAAVEIARDITESKRFQAQMVHHEKMAALGTLAAGLAHEIGNPLASMSSELEMLELDWDTQAARASVPVLRDQIHRMARLLRELVEFGRHPTEAEAWVRALDVVEDAARLLRHAPRAAGVNIEARAEPEDLSVWSNRDRLLQVLVNLGLNALDAVGGEGSVSLVAFADGDVRFEVTDTGTGVPAAVVERMFEPFFTTKPPDEGTGMGLFVSERIVESLGGRLELTSSDESGTRFAVVLPVTSAPLEA